METNKSTVIRTLDLVWDAVHRSNTWSWLRLNSCMHKALKLAIISGMKFEAGDLGYISQEFRWGWWCGDGEHYYTLAVAENNMSAIHALKTHWGRKPFITDNVHPAGAQPRQRGRLACATQFYWNGEMVTVTSFNEHEGIVIACTYKPYELDERGYCTGPRKVAHIYKISHKELKEANSLYLS